jgi:hypothetical protein
LAPDGPNVQSKELVAGKWLRYSTCVVSTPVVKNVRVAARDRIENLERPQIMCLLDEQSGNGVTLLVAVGSYPEVHPLASYMIHVSSFIVCLWGRLSTYLGTETDEKSRCYNLWE